MELCQVMGLPLDPDALDFVRRCERPPFGIDINPTSVSSSLECLRAGLHLLCLFGSYADVSRGNPQLYA